MLLMGTLKMERCQLQMKQKIHPIWYVVGVSLGISLLGMLAKGEQQTVATNTGPVDYHAELSKAITEIADADAHGDMSWLPKYQSVILGLDAHCTESLSEVINLSVAEIEKRDEDGYQFALLNEMEETLYLVQQAPQQPASCASLIEKRTY